MASSTKALARAFTKRVKRSSSDANISPTRSSSTRHGRGAIDRGLISLPTELISTTNVQVLTAPNIHGGLRSSSGSTTSESDSEFSTIDRSFLDRTSESSSPVQSTASTPFSSPMDDVDSFFGSKRAADIGSPDLASFMNEAPVLPVRAPSHSKKAHVELSRKRSMQRLSPPPTAISQSSVRGSTELFNTTTDPSHPFVKELAKVTEVAEEFGAVNAVVEEERDLYRRGLYKFSASEYLEEIAGLSGGVFENRLGLMANPWI